MKVDRDILNNLCLNITDGEHGTIQNDNDGRYFLLSNKNIINGQIIISDADRRINKESFSKINKRTKLENGDLVISTVGVLGKLAIIKAENLNYDFQRSVGIIKCDEKKINTKYLYYYLNTQFVQNRLNHLSKGAVQKCLFISDLKNLEIDFPDLPTQQKIASVLSALDDKIELNNRINAELEAMVKTLYDYWFVQFDFPNIEGKPYKTSGGKMVYNETLKREIPEGWEVKSLSGLVDFTRGISYTSSTINDNEGIPMINLKSFNLNGTYRIDGLKYFTGKLNENKIINKNDLLIAITDVTREAEIIGKAILSPDFGNKTVCSCDVARIDILKNSFSKNYLRYLFNSNHYHNYIKHFASGTLVLHLDLNGILWYKDIIPPINLQNKFEDVVNEIDEKITNNLKQNQELSALRDWLLPMLMNGQVKVG